MWGGSGRLKSSGASPSSSKSRKRSSTATHALTGACDWCCLALSVSYPSSQETISRGRTGRCGGPCIVAPMTRIPYSARIAQSRALRRGVRRQSVLRTTLAPVRSTTLRRFSSLSSSRRPKRLQQMTPSAGGGQQGRAVEGGGGSEGGAQAARLVSTRPRRRRPEGEGKKAAGSALGEHGCGVPSAHDGGRGAGLVLARGAHRYRGR